MTSFEHGFAIFFIIFGAFEIISNLYHLSKRTMEEKCASAKKQHQEIPPDLPERHYYLKAVTMLLFGLLFFISGLTALLMNCYICGLFYLPMILFAIYSFAQAIKYKYYWRVWSALVVYNLPLALFILLH